MGYKTTEDGYQVFSPWLTEGSRKTLISHRWNDPTTWVEGSTRHTEQACSAVVAGTSYQMPHSNIIDLVHGKIWDEDDVALTAGVVVEVDAGSGWEEKTQVDPHDGAGEYTVNYETGLITFSPAIPTGASVRASYNAAGGSTFTIAPTSGKKLLIKSAEVQFSADVGMTDTVKFETFGFVEVFAPQLCTDNGGPYPPGTKIPLKKTVYKSLQQFIDESNGAYPVIPAIGGPTWRGIASPITVFPWDYAAALPIESSKGMEVRITLLHDTPFTGSYATATFYCLSVDEVTGE